VPIVKHHHERFDGTGYPSGLKGEEIPFGARILTTVDCYDALTSSRPYRAQFTREQALDLMRRESGRTFDPVVLAKFLEVVDELEVSLPVLTLRPSSLVGVEPLDCWNSQPSRSRHRAERGNPNGEGIARHFGCAKGSPLAV
jgi:HD-GYP domain-containing protein (c-di-GMP phosphodiesterase class II)